MSKFSEKFKKVMKIPFAFFVIMFVFLLAVLGTSGSVRPIGKSYELVCKSGSDGKDPCIMFRLSEPTVKDKDGNETTVSVNLKSVYVNVGTVYSSEKTVSLRLRRVSNGSDEATFSRTGLDDLVLENPWYDEAKAPDSGKNTTVEEKAVKGAIFNWVEGFITEEYSDTYRRVANYPYYQLYLPGDISNYTNSNVVINEVVFVGESIVSEGEESKLYVLPVEIDARTYKYLPEQNTQSKETALKTVSAVIDAQQMPTSVQSSFFRYGAEETDMMATLAEMRFGKRYTQGDSYHGDKSYGSLGVSLAALGTAIFGVSPFGLRFFECLASFGILVVGYFLVKEMFKSDKAALSFAVIYALSGISLSIAHIASPAVIGVFFLITSLYLCYRYYENGMKKASPVSTLPLALSGLCGALAILVNGAFVVPVAGVVALFIAGAVKERRKGREALDEAIALVEAEEEAAAKSHAKAKEETEPAEESENRSNLRKVLNDYRYKTGAACGVFVGVLLLGIFVLSLLFSLPVSYAFAKVYTDSAKGFGNLFLVSWNAFKAGFGGAGANGWNYFYRAFEGAGEQYAITLVSVNFAAAVLGLMGIAYGVYRILKCAGKNASASEYMRAIVPLALLVLSLVCAAFAGGAIGFILLAHVAAFLLIAGGAEELKKEGGTLSKAVAIGKIVALVLLVCCFALTAVFTFSIPLPATLIGKIF